MRTAAQETAPQIALRTCSKDTQRDMCDFGEGAIHAIRCLVFVFCLVPKLCPTLCDPMDCNTPGSSVHGIPQARTLEWVAISFSNASK